MANRDFTYCCNYSCKNKKCMRHYTKAPTEGLVSIAEFQCVDSHEEDEEE